ncbi:hypothetical protein TWF594_008874 [Orbilia oligospora]|uniref:Peptidase S33 tripeptidyl aminopeptidase-like C-terminal domain-containing protein n=1 Tax=Orbilia oligospora TaxID=2813651 RepID=A0A7C8NN75_ORBOL|nr:hypothetical protein TWF594_008874 [Orbilia oligospora]KAF3140974.1 hypothetical protein TWF703_002481 [Orbilia oligospora]
MKSYLFAAAAAIVPNLAFAVPTCTGEKQYFFDTIPASVDLKWYPCNQTYECARLSVPLNPLEPKNGLRSEIPIIKRPAKCGSGEYKGIILTNPGGPGGLGIEFIFTYGETIANFTGPGWDIIGFDPRGMGYSKPNGAIGWNGVPLVAANLQNATYLTQKQLGKRAIRPDHYGLKIAPRPAAWIDTVIESGVEFNELLQAKANADNQAVPYMTTPNVAFDMLQIAKADARLKGKPEENVLVNYYGLSYGSVVGQTFTSLYPQHVGRFVIDSVVDLEDWYNADIRSTLQHTDEGVSTFFTTCFDAGPEKCAFFTGHTSGAIRDRFNNLWANFDTARGIQENWANVTDVSVGQEVMKNILIQVPYNAIVTFPAYAKILATVETLVKVKNATAANMEEISVQWTGPPDPSDPVRGENALEAWCSDSNNPRMVGSDLPVPQEFIDTVHNYSVSSGERFIQVYGICSRLKLRPKWRFSGKIGGATKTPVLFIGLSKDPVTPFENAEKARTLHKGAKMIYVDAVGHGILGQRNWCVFDKVRAYFQNLTLPGHDNRCPRSEIPFQYIPETPREKREAWDSMAHHRNIVRMHRSIGLL